MKYVHCPRCRAQFHTGFIYDSVEECARCGAALFGVMRLRDQLRAVLRQRSENLDWEAITGSQYIPRRAVATGPGRGGTGPLS